MYMDEKANTTVRRPTKSLFHEMWITTPVEFRTGTPKFSLHRDKPGLINFGKEYIEYGDMTGYKMAKKYLENYSHWNLLMKTQWFQEAKRIWDEEIEARLFAESMETLVAISKGEGPQALQAAKFLAIKGYRTAGTKASTRGRPTKEQVEGELKREAEDAKTINDDFKRILKAVK
jgi:hypothetical protein